MATVEVQHSGNGGNSVDEPASMVDPAEAFFRDLVNKMRRDLPSAFDFALTRDRFGWFQEFERLRNMATLYDRGLFSRAVTESCNKKYGDDSIIRNLVLRLLLPSENYLTILINESLNNYSLTSATEVIFSLRSSEIPRIKGSYSSQFGRELKDDIENFTFGEHRKLLLKYIRVASAPERNDLRAEMLRDECCEEILRSLNKNVIETFKCPRMAIGNCVFGLREEHMRAVVEGYHKKYGRPLEKDLTLANYGHPEHALVTKIKCAVNRPGYYAEKLCEAMIDRYTRAMRDIDHIDRETIVRVITTLAEIDMKMMKEEYRQKSGRALQDDISDALSDRQDCLLLILLILNPINSPN